MPLYLSEAEVCLIHSWAIREYDGRPGILDHERLRSSIELPKTDVFGHVPYPTLAEKAAAYAYYIALNHPFVDGNKRTSLLASIHFLRRNGLAHVFDEDAITDEILAVSIAGAPIDGLIELFRRPR